MADFYADFFNANGTAKSPAIRAPEVCYLTTEEHDLLLAGDLALNDAEQMAKTSRAAGNDLLEIIKRLALGEFTKRGIKEADLLRTASKIKQNQDTWYSIVIAGLEGDSIVPGLLYDGKELGVLQKKSMAAHQEMAMAKTLKAKAEALRLFHGTLKDLLPPAALYLEPSELGAAERLLEIFPPSVNAEPMEQAILTMDPVSNAIFGYSHHLNQGIFIPTIGTDKGIVSVVLDMDKIGNAVKIYSELSETDQLVYEAIITAFHNGYQYFWPGLIYKIASGWNPNADASPKALKEIEQSIDNLTRTLISIDFTKQNEAFTRRKITLPDGATATQTDHLISARKTKIRYKGQEIAAYEFHRNYESPLYDYAKAGNYLYKIPIKAFDTVGQYKAIAPIKENGKPQTARTGLNEMATGRRILRLIHTRKEEGRQYFKLTYTTLFSYLYPDRDSKSIKAHQSRDAKKIFRILDAFQAQNVIIGYEEYTAKKNPQERRAATGVRIILSEKPAKKAEKTASKA